MNSQRLVRVGHKDLENVKALVLHHFAVIAKQVHAYLQMISAVDVSRHNTVVRAVQQDFSKKFDRLAFGDIATGLYQGTVVSLEEYIEVRRQVSRDEVLMSR